MKPEELVDKEIYISKNSITIKDENNKTRGVVRNISCMKDMQANKLFALSSKLKKEYGFTQKEMMDKIKYLFPYEDKVFFFASNGLIDREKRIRMNHDYENGVKNLKSRGIAVVYCKEIHDSRKWV